MSRTAVVMLADGRRFEGVSVGAPGTVAAEIVCATGMTGYQEALTDPASSGHIIAMTAPHIGNTGVNDDDFESDRAWADGLIMRDASPAVSSWRATGSLEDMLREYGIVAVGGVDTRALARHLRGRGPVRGVISSEPADDADLTALIDATNRPITPVGHTGYVLEPDGPVRATVVAVDLGLTSAAAHRLNQSGALIHVVPPSTRFGDVAAYAPDGVFVSSGPGDPAEADDGVALIGEVLDRRIPVFGTGLGHQVLAHALGCETYRLDSGHHSLNHPVRDIAQERVPIAAHSHDYAVRVPAAQFSSVFGEIRVTHISLNDGVVEGISLTGQTAFGVQFDPAGGPHDTTAVFDRFVDAIARPAGQED